jgi:hypothetical protein
VRKGLLVGKTLAERRHDGLKGLPHSEELRACLKEEVFFSLITADGDLKWSPDWDKFSPEEKAKMKSLMPKIP